MTTNDTLDGPIDRSLHTILVVDDNPATRYATVRLLGSVGFQTREALSGLDALSKADESLSAMVLDVHLPDIDGFEVCRRLRSEARLARLPVLHLSAAYVTDEDKVRGLDAGADAYLTHPVEPAVLIATVQALVRARMAEAAMRRSEAKFRALYAQAPSGICLVDAEGRFTDANPALLDVLRHERDAIVGKRLVDFVPAAAMAEVEARIKGRELEGWRAVLPMLAGTGEALHIEWRVSPPFEPGLSIAVATDVSERVMLEQARRELLEREQDARAEAERVSRLKDDLIAVLSHELRTPLNAIMGWTHLLQKRGGSDELLRGLSVIERNGKTQARLISDILDVSSINMGKLRLNFERVEPDALLKQSLETMSPALEDRSDTLVVDMHGPYSQVMADPARFQQIVWNLMSNAIKFSPPRSTITVTLTERNGQLMLSVADEGAGIAPAFLPHLFDRFSQGNASSNRAHSGLGLGLSIVRHLVQLHGGSITAQSAGPGLGSVFTVTLDSAVDGGGDPVAAVDEANTAFAGLPAEPQRAKDELDGLQVLTVDDDVEAGAMVQIILSDRGAVVHTAAGHDEALDLLKVFAPDILISDVGMPGKDGYQLLREIRAAERDGRRVPAIALTSYTRSKDVDEARAAGFDRHLGKPVHPIELIRTIVELMSAARSAVRPV